jgi:hypothetical protein
MKLILTSKTIRVVNGNMSWFNSKKRKRVSMKMT